LLRTSAGVQFVKDLLEPKLVGLMDHDERISSYAPLAFRPSSYMDFDGEEFVDFEIAPIICGLPRAVERTLHPELSRIGQCRVNLI
jgi:hypothetical protein